MNGIAADHYARDMAFPRFKVLWDPITDNTHLHHIRHMEGIPHLTFHAWKYMN
jgi:hypothetical protein